MLQNLQKFREIKALWSIISAPCFGLHAADSPLCGPVIISDWWPQCCRFTDHGGDISLQYRKTAKNNTWPYYEIVLHHIKMFEKCKHSSVSRIALICGSYTEKIKTFWSKKNKDHTSLTFFHVSFKRARFLNWIITINTLKTDSVLHWRHFKRYKQTQRNSSENYLSNKPVQHIPGVKVMSELEINEQYYTTLEIQMN